MATTQFRAGLGYGGMPYGSFAGKEESAGSTSGTRRQRQIKSLTRARRRRRWEPGLGNFWRTHYSEIEGAALARSCDRNFCT